MIFFLNYIELFSFFLNLKMSLFNFSRIILYLRNIIRDELSLKNPKWLGMLIFAGIIKGLTATILQNQVYIMQLNKLQRLKLSFKILISATFSLLLSCSGGDNANNASQPINKLYAFDGYGSDLRIVEVNPETGNLIASVFGPEPMQASLDSQYVYFSSTNQLLIRRDVYEGEGLYQLIKVNIDTKEVEIIPSEDYDNIITGNGKLFGFKRIFENSLLSINLVEINHENALTIATMQIFEPLDGAPQNNSTGISGILYSQATNQLLIRRRISFTSDISADQLIKINATSGAKEIVTTNHYESMVVGKNGRLFAVKRSYASNGGLTFYGIVEVNINNGAEINILKEFDLPNSFTDCEITFLGDTNELLIDKETLYKINVDNGVESSFNDANDFYRFRSINVY